MSGRRRTALLVASVAILLAIVAVTGPAAPTGSDTEPGGILAFERLLEHTGVEAMEGSEPPGPPGTFLLLQDLREEREERPLMDWVSRGGRLVVADANSAMLSMLGAEPGGRLGLVSETVGLEPGCISPETSDVSRLQVLSSAVALRPVAAGWVGCFPGGDGWFALSRAVGSGKVIAVGSASPFTNELLDQGDDAIFGRRVVGTGPVVVGPPLPPGAQRHRGVWAALPDRAKAVVVLIGVAVVAFAIARARRLGRPVSERPSSPIPGTELVTATGALYRAARQSGYAGEVVRRGAVRRIARRVGVGEGAPDEAVVIAAARAGGESEGRVRTALTGAAPVTDEGLIEAARELESIVRSVERAR